MAQATPTRRRTLADAVDDAAYYSYEHQLHLATTVGIGATWRLVPELGCAHFTGHREMVCPAQIIGVVKGNIWEWGWASANVSPPRAALASVVREFGRTNDMPALTQPRLEIAGSDATRLVTASKIIHRRWTTFAFPVDGMVMHAVVEHPSLTLPAPTVKTLCQTLTGGQQEVPVTNGRRAVRSYAQLRAVARQDRRDRSATRLVLPTGKAVMVTYSPDDGTITSTEPA
ncbi:DUF6882 domain-containing protein [Dietzia maris]|uniref:DUF6882 domain-containing protein n=1 Tax=Dietzia maris TaxID=37915 RepID=UPI0037C79009